MRISIGSDHRGLDVKDALANHVRSLGHEVTDEGPCNGESVDYPDIAAIVGRKIAASEIDRGILICGTGIGMAITANKFPHVRAAVANEVRLAKVCREHNDANVICVSGDLPEEGAARSARLEELQQILSAFLTTAFEGGRHARRVDKISAVEEQVAKCCS